MLNRRADSLPKAPTRKQNLSRQIVFLGTASGSMELFPATVAQRAPPVSLVFYRLVV